MWRRVGSEGRIGPPTATAPIRREAGERQTRDAPGRTVADALAQNPAAIRAKLAYALEKRRARAPGIQLRS